MLELGQIKIGYQKSFDDEKGMLRDITAKRLRIKAEEMRKFEIYKRSLDARSKPDIFYIYSVRFLSDDEEGILKKNKNNRNLRQVKRQVMYESRLTQLREFAEERIIVVGSGPAGLFAAYSLSLRGMKPIVIERGYRMEDRIEEVEAFWKTGVLNEECNVCFGEGGAGTFSDGKLNSGVKDKDGAKRFILETFVRFGAGRDILYDAKPHIGTDVLRRVIVNMRQAMEKQGCVFLFRSKVNGIMQKDGHITGILFEQEKQDAGSGKQSDTDSPFEDLTEEHILECSRVIFAIGHSARDTFELLEEDGVRLQPKAFAVGVRIQHRQEAIDQAQYGGGDTLPTAYYKLTGKTEDGRGVYSFCMCPGGYVVNASSESGYLVVNGMSDVARDSGYANAAIVVTVNPSESEDGSDADNVFVGMDYQRELERNMYRAAKGKIPVQRYGEFRKEIENSDADENPGEGVKAGTLSNNQPAVKGLWCYADVAASLPADIARAVVEAVDQFGKKIKGFDTEDTLVMGIESRTSSPVRIVRDEESLQSVTMAGLYPCGEGAGYAGGILSAAMDGLRVAEVIGSELKA